MREYSELVSLSTRIAAFGLPPAERPPVSVDEEIWPVLSQVLTTRRLTGIALAALDEGWLSLPAGCADDLVERHREQMLQCLAIERSLLRVASAFRREGVGFCVLKGPVLAAFYPDPSWRSFGDLDLLVRTSEWRRACEVLAAIGYRRDMPEPRRGFDERFGKAATHTNPEGLQLDLHRTLTLGPFGLWLDPERLIDGSVPFTLGGTVFDRLSDTDTLLHACMHASLGWAPPLPLPVRDVAQVALTGSIDWDSLRDRVVRWRLSAVVRDALRVAVRDLAVDLPAEAEPLTRLTPAARELKALAAYQSGRRSIGGISMSTAMAIPSLRGRAEYALGLLLPSRDFLRARGQGADSYVARWKVPLGWAAHRWRAALHR